MTEYEVTLEWPDGRKQTVGVDPRETVLEAAGRAGVRLPADCRSGTCTTCAGRVLAVDGGEFEADNGENADEDQSIDAARAFDYRRVPEALTDRERADGYVLLCIALPRADCRVAVGPMIRSELGDSPWG
ncbi:2Fe-2S iron-sulfur cluster-binding protein [Natrialbaceae archaeon A-arb3/5]